MGAYAAEEPDAKETLLVGQLNRHAIDIAYH